MKEFVISEAQVETAILVGLITQTQDERKTKEYLDELEFLAETAGATVVKRFTQKLPAANSVTYVGKGKLEEIKEYIHQEEENEREVGMVIFDDELSAKQIRNIEAELKVKILDRTSLILDIFAELKLIQMDVWKETVQRLPVTGMVQLEQSAIFAEIQEKTGRVSYDK